MTQKLKEHLAEENPSLVPLIPVYDKLDSILRSLKILDKNETLTKRIGFWPVLSVVGLYSAGKSTFINDFLGDNIQKTGTQAVDDKFTVIAYGNSKQELPGVALDADERFPFHGMREEIEQVATGEGKKIDRFLSLKTMPSDKLKGLLLIDSPGFDSDEYRAATLKLVDHILDLSDLTLVLFDANKCEPGVMRDTLNLLVKNINNRGDLSKFLFILNKVDGFKEDNIEEVVASWQKALATVGVNPSQFYMTYSANSHITDVSTRIQEKRNNDMNAIMQKISKLPETRGYRIASEAKTMVHIIKTEILPYLDKEILSAKKRTNTLTWGALGALAVSVFGVSALFGDITMPLDLLLEPSGLGIGAVLLTAGLLRWKIGNMVFKHRAKTVRHEKFDLTKAFMSGRLPFIKYPLSWYFNKSKIAQVETDIGNIVVDMNKKL